MMMMIIIIVVKTIVKEKRERIKEKVSFKQDAHSMAVKKKKK